MRRGGGVGADKEQRIKGVIMGFVAGCLIGLVVGFLSGVVLVSILAVGAAAERDMEWIRYAGKRGVDNDEV